MANKGLQFEHAVMYVATSRITDRNSEQESDFNDAAGRWSSIPKDIKDTAEKIVLDMAPSGDSQRQKYFGSFRKMSGGGEEPKTDILFMIGGKKYKCSMKWGKSYQLTSAGVDKSIQVFTKVLKKVAMDIGKSGMGVNELGNLQLVLEQMANKFENSSGTMDQDTAKRLMSDVKKAGGINEQLQEILGSKKAPNGAEAYDAFKFELTKECMTGEMLFNGDDRAADHLFTEDGVKPITDKVVRDVMKIAGVRLSLKGRGKKNGVRQNAISIRYEV
jgi:hypothetical protein|tara:strand:+ start:42 stop:863 length:822 start_codon:yes stop_codon:yes gene_type:complete